MMSAQKWIGFLVLAAMSFPVLAAEKYTIVGNNENEIALFDQQKPAAVEAAKGMDKVVAKIERLMDKGRASPPEVKEMDASVAALEKSTSGFIMFKSPVYGCSSAAQSLARYWASAIGRRGENLDERLAAYKVDRKQCKVQINERPKPQDIVRVAPGAPAPWRGCLMILDASKENPKHQDWSCPKK